jgi:pimeloyl-ACP methyl ester carboxylesterase
MAYLGAFYRTYALDFWGFGESGKKRETYAVSDFVSLVNQLWNSWGLSGSLVHSMGGSQSFRCH